MDVELLPPERIGRGLPLVFDEPGGAACYWWSTAPGPASATCDRNGHVDVRAALKVIEDGFR